MNRLSPHSTRLFVATNLKELPLQHASRTALSLPQWSAWGKSGATVAFNLSSELLPRVREIVPCFSLLQEAPYSYQIEFKIFDLHGGEHVVPLAAVGAFENPIRAAEEHNQLASSEIDTLVVHKDLKDIEVTLRIEGSSPQDLAKSSWMFSLAQRTPPAQRIHDPTTEENLPGIAIELPAFSQMLVPEIGKRICSPTCIAMLVTKDPTSPIEPKRVSDIAFCAAHDMYGVWPWSIYAASRFGKLGVLTFFETWQDAKKTLDQRLPIVASIRYGKGEITGVALERETEKPEGHLVVIRGYQDDSVLVHDPAAPENESVARAYKLSEFLKVWLERSAMGYVLF